jgi:LuxR family transcriptional regulator, maltose regulon positive regulatory protein
MEGRWTAAVTTVIGGAGFGKSTLLAQAYRHNLARPRGIEAWVACEPGDEDAERLADAVLRSLDAPPAFGDPSAAIVGALRHTSPVPICLMLDDFHEIPANSSAIDLLTEVLRALPAHAHLVFAGREPCPLPLARLQAADRLLAITHDDLALRPEEVKAMAAARGEDADRLAPLGGWPALVRLALAAPIRVARQFVWEEVVAHLSDDDRQALLALATLGTADEEMLSELCGRPVDTDHLTATVPLIDPTGDGRIRAHDLWQEMLASILPSDDMATMGRAAIERLLVRGSYLRAGSLAVRIGDGEGLCRAAHALVKDTLSNIPVDTASAWLRATPFDYRDRPEILLLDAALRNAVRHRDEAVDGLLDAALHGFRSAGNHDGEHVALALRLVVAHGRSDLAASAGLLVEIEKLRDTAVDPTLWVLAPAVEANVAHLRGDVDEAAAILDAIPLAGVAPTVAEALQRMRWHMLLFAGQSGEATRLATELVAASTPNAPLFAPIARWSGGDPSGFDGDAYRLVADIDTRGPNDELPYVRDWFNHGVFMAMVAGAAGDRPTLDRALRLLAGLGVNPAEARNAIPMALARATQAVVDHHDEAAGQLEAVGADHPPSDRFAEIYFRRFLTLPYICLADARTLWDEAPLGPAQRLQREVARALIAARAGELTAASVIPPAPSVYTALPLPWSVELAVRADAARNPAGRALAQWLVDRHQSVVHDELRRLGRGPDRTLSATAQRLLGGLSFPPERVTRVELVGPFRLLIDGKNADRREQRRARVRELVAILAVLGSVERERAMDYLWPELPPADSARNLRVTLTHMRRLLEPERGRGDAGYHLRVEGDRLRLAASDRLEVDVWEIRHHLRAAAAADANGDLAGQTEHLAAAVDRWRGEPLVDLDRIADLRTEVDHLRARLMDAALTLGELRLAEGDPVATAQAAERVLAADPYAERALRLLVAAHLQRGDRGQTQLAVERALATFDELGVGPEPATAILLRQAGVTAPRVVALSI